MAQDVVVTHQALGKSSKIIVGTLGNSKHKVWGLKGSAGLFYLKPHVDVTLARNSSLEPEITLLTSACTPFLPFQPWL